MQTVSGAVIVLFNPSEAHVINLVHLKRLCDEIIAVDNSPESDLHLHGRISASGVEILSNRNAGGVAGAYNKGIERLIEKGCRLFFILDQDSQVEEDYFVQMRDACTSLDTPHFLIGPKIFDVNVNRYLPAHLLRRFSLKAIPVTDQRCGLLRCSSIITSGSMMSLDTYRVLGPFMEDYFIDHVDTEYSFRAMCTRVPVYINTSVVLKHQVGKRLDHKILFFKLIQWNTGPIRQYYSARNCIHISRRYGAQFPLLSLVNIITIQQILSIVLYETDKPRKIVAMAAGVIDGLRGRYGSIRDLQATNLDLLRENKLVGVRTGVPNGACVSWCSALRAADAGGRSRAQ